MKTKEERKQELVELGLPMAKVDDVILLEDEMFKRAMKFQYRKKDGSIRDAVGTLIREKMVDPDGKVWEPKGVEKKLGPMWFKYWDLGCAAWRQFNIFNLVAVEG